MATKQQYKKVIHLFQVSDTAKKTCTSCFKGTMNRNLQGQFLSNRGCCGSCSKSAGYLDKHYSPDDILKIKQDFNFDEKEKGFLTKTGCKLPYEIRSGVCIGYSCWNLYSRLSAAGVDKELLHDKHEVWIDETKRKYKP